MDFKNTIIILTSNLGSSYLLDGITPDGEISEDARNKVMSDLRASFRPEFLNRLDEIIMFKPLTKDNLGGIIENLLNGLRARLADRGAGGLKLEVTDAAKRLSSTKAMTRSMGARPLKRYLQSAAETLIAKVILAGNIDTGSTLVLDESDGKLVCNVK